LDPGDGQGRCFFPGCDYYHPSVAELDDDALADPFSDPFDRAVQCRMPWHDVHCRVAGEAARDVAISFVQRWNHHHWSDDEVPRPLPLIPRVGGPGAAPAGRAATAQVLRSLASWNGGAFHETSIYNAWLDAIERSERFIYIEQQFFISSLAGEPVVNRVAEALLTRLSRAIRERARFRVVVVLPVHPEGNFREQSKVWALLGWQYRTISRGGQSLLERLRDEFPGVDLDDYVAFFSLRGHAVTPDRCVTSQIYVHSKLVIVDDRLAIIGSANINDRSLLGVRDSEIALRIETPAGMGANPVRDFRVALWNHHLGLPEHSQACADPTSELVYRDLWLATADSNTELYQRVFPDLPHSRFTTLAELEEAGPGPIEPGRLAGVRGTLVRHPLGFLANEDLTTSPWDVEFVLGDDLLT
ncbi:MAG: hypothetical protein HY815_09125, partial [Candidatus Riflebacteria bacterium]|nr:hypothetical protein [Candidatus Riflebacteria bacterium]